MYGPIIVVDSREQLGYTFREYGAYVYRDNLRTGDYTIEGYRDYICVERKTLTDFYGSIGKGHGRFFRTLARMARIRHRLLVVESNVESLMNPKRHRFTRLQRAQVLGNVSSILAHYGIPIYLADTRRLGEEITWQFMVRAYDILTTEEGNPLVPALYSSDILRCSMCGTFWRDVRSDFPDRTQRSFYRTAYRLRTGKRTLGKRYHVCLLCRRAIKRGIAELPEGVSFAWNG